MSRWSKENLQGWQKRCEIAESALAASQQRVTKLRTALERLVTKLDEVHTDKRYQSVWTSYMVHGGTYTGPQYREELEQAREALAEDPQGNAGDAE